MAGGLRAPALRSIEELSRAGTLQVVLRRGPACTWPVKVHLPDRGDAVAVQVDWLLSDSREEPTEEIAGLQVEGGKVSGRRRVLSRWLSGPSRWHMRKAGGSQGGWGEGKRIRRNVEKP